MSECGPPCKHDRLLHDSWGCKVCKTSCGVSVIYLTPNLYAAKVDKAQEQQVLAQAKALDAELDRKAERDAAIMYERSVEESQAA